MSRSYHQDRSMSSLLWPGHRKAARSKEAEALAQTIVERGEYNMPTISGESGEVILGRATVAALLRLKYTKVRCIVVWQEDVTETATTKTDQVVSEPPGSLAGVQGFRSDIETFGIGTNEVWEAGLNVLQLRHKRASLMVKKAKAELERIDESGIAHHGLGPLIKLLETTWTAIDMASPAALCPYCKGLEIECVSCGGVRWVGSAGLADAPDELLDDEDVLVEVDGDYVPFDKAAP